MTPAETAIAALRVEEEFKNSGQFYTDKRIAEALGLSTPYINRLLRIGRALSKSALQYWLNENVTMAVMQSVSEKPKNTQLRIAKQLSKEARAPARGRGSWVHNAEKEAYLIGVIIKKLERNGAIVVKNLKTASKTPFPKIAKQLLKESTGVDMRTARAQVEAQFLDGYERGEYDELL